MTGKLTLSELKARARRGEIETVIAAFTDHYGRLLGKRFSAAFFLEEVAGHGTHACDYLLTTDMEMNPVAGYSFANWELGYGDFHLVPDLPTLHVASWLDKTALVHCNVEGVDEAPRSILRGQIEAAAKAGYGAMAATELEYYAYRNSYRDAAKTGYAQLEPLGHYLEDYHLLQGARSEFYTAAVRRHLEASGIPVENSKGEWGLGQHEVNVRYAEVLAMADRHMSFKQCCKELADALGISVTFMPKPFEGQAGSSCHIHLSLWKGRRNVFANDSDLFRWFLGGWIQHAPEFMVFYAPTINSYKRYEDMSWAPTRLAWSRDNRTAGFRVVGHGASQRIECRIPGADANPYLALAASLASGLDGIRRRIEPPPVFEGDVYAAQHLPRVPYSLGEAVELFAGSAFVEETLGKKVAAHYTHFYRSEARAFGKAVTDWERKRYFERI
ncbi:MAG: glutamine synthetase [Bryobacterales bacterium]|nr:glutamine synthetase [Bryobacterales bacterium]